MIIIIIILILIVYTVYIHDIDNNNTFTNYYYYFYLFFFFTSSLVYGSSLALTSGATSYVEARGMMDIDIVTVSADHQFMVLYSDYSNYGIVTAVIGEV
jgi:hypothetical protein